uniref:Uncharacterized protein n=1 Tax=Oryza barthii TaxID=65489 RepID=A0A0D3G1B0_9ORYZ
MVASGPWLFMVICHLRDYGLSVPKMSDFSNQEHQLPPRGPRPLLTDGYRSIIPHKRGYRELGTKVSSLVDPPSTSHVGARRRQPHPPLSMPQWSLSPATAPPSSTPHTGLIAIAGARVLRRHVPR